MHYLCYLTLSTRKHTYVYYFLPTPFVLLGQIELLNVKVNKIYYIFCHYFYLIYQKSQCFHLINDERMLYYCSWKRLFLNFY